MKQIFNSKLLSPFKERNSVQTNVKTAFLIMLFSVLTISANTLNASETSVSIEDNVTQNTITGTVVDNTGSPLPGVNIIIVGTIIGGQTDFDGNFTIQASSGDILEFSYIGMKTTKITVGSETNYNVNMFEDASALDEVVIVGYGTKLKTDLTGAVGTVKAEELVHAPMGIQISKNNEVINF